MIQVIKKVENTFQTQLDGASVIITPQLGKPPLLQSAKWKGEAWLNIQLQDLMPKPLTTPSFDGGVFGWKDNKGNDHRHYTKPYPSGFTQDGLLEHEIILYSKPASNLLTFLVDCSPNIEWCYQPALTPQETADGDFRPPNVVGSYALYINKANNFVNRHGELVIAYETGKFSHLYALTLIDAVGKISYAPLNWNPITKILTAIMDKTWLNKAIYPIIIDPEIGWSTQGGSDGTRTDAFAVQWAAVRYTGVTGDTVTQYHCYGHANDTDPQGFSFAIYDWDGSKPVNRLAAATAILMNNNTPPIKWDSSAVSQALVNGTVYVCAAGDRTGAAAHISYDVGVSNDMALDSGAILNAVFNNTSNTAQKRSIWATVTTGAGVDVETTTDTLVLTEYPAAVNAAISIPAGYGELALTEYPANINAEINVNADVANLSLTEYQATVNAEISISASCDSLSLTAYQADVSINAEINVNADVANLSLTEYQAEISLDVNIQSALANLALSPYAANINAAINVQAGFDLLSLSEYQANINAGLNIATNIDNLFLTAYLADVGIRGLTVVSSMGWDGEISNKPLKRYGMKLMDRDKYPKKRKNYYTV